MFKKLHDKLGDFWWYSLILFCACRAADVLNAFVGLWLVPKYIEPAELGAVLPLSSFAALLAMPVAVFATTFRTEVSRLSLNHEFGQLKTLIKSVFISTAVLLVIAIIVSHILLPSFLNRIRIVNGSLGIIILTTAFINAIAPIFTNTIQALKKFKANALMNLLGAPIRLVTMLTLMPYRALSGYFIGQGASPTFNILASAFFLRKELTVPAQPYWTKDLMKRFSKLLLIFAASSGMSTVASLTETTILRQRLPDIDSAGYYMAARFAEIAGFLFMTLCFTIFPISADLAAKGKDTRPLLFKAAGASLAFSAIIAIPFFFIGRYILTLLPNGDQYAAYWWVIPSLIGINYLTSFLALYSTTEISANRFGFMKWMIPMDLAYTILLFSVTGYGYFVDFLPHAWTTFLTAHNIRSLDTMLIWMASFNAIKVIGCLIEMKPRQ